MVKRVTGSESHPSSSGIPDAPNDGNYYARRNESWESIQTLFDSTVGEKGQIKVNYAGLGIVGVTDNTEQTFDIDAATPTISSGATDYPNSAPNQTYSDLFDDTRSTDNPAGIVGKLIENPVDKQAHNWRIQFEYANKGGANNLGLDICLKNPTSGFEACEAVTLPSGTTSGRFDVNIVTIADSASIPSPNGYNLAFTPSVTDINFTLDVLSITRICGAVKL